MNAPAAAAPQTVRSGVGIRNVNQRLKLLYGDDYTFTISEPRAGRILARIVLSGQK